MIENLSWFANLMARLDGHQTIAMSGWTSILAVTVWPNRISCHKPTEFMVLGQNLTESRPYSTITAYLGQKHNGYKVNAFF
jgi:hypothetical protein